MKPSIKVAVRTLAVTGALAAGAFAIPTAANAAVSNCTKGTLDNNRAYVTCTATGGSQYRAHVQCAKVDEPSITYWINGPWVSSGKSITGCKAGTFINQIQHQVE